MEDLAGAGLTERERQVALVAAAGRSTRAIADELYISVRTVESHLASIYRKLGVESRAHLVAKLTAFSTDSGPDRNQPFGSAGVSPTRRRSDLTLMLPGVQDFVGREGELAAIEEALRRSDDGEARLLLVSGESGIGKSTLLAEAMQRGAETSRLVLVGRCVEGLSMPFGPLLDALRPALEAHCGPLKELTGPGGAHLCSLFPELASLLPGPPPAVPAAARARLVTDALIGLVDTLCRREPVVLILDDLQWADRATMSFLSQLAGTANPVPLLVIASFRNTEVGPAHPLSPLLAAAGRVGNVDRIELHGLGLSEAQELARQALGPAVSECLVAEAHTASAGNAFYLTQLLAHADSSGQPSTIPASLRAVVLDRVQRVRASLVGPLDLAAVLGLDFDLSVVEAAMPGADIHIDRPAIDVIEAAVHAGLLEPDDLSAESFRFVHDVVRRTLLDQLNPTRRARLEAAVGRGLLETWGNDDAHLPAIAGHLCRSSRTIDRIDGATAALQAIRGRNAMAALDDAAELGGTALAALPSSLAADAVRLDLLIALAEIHHLRLDYTPHRTAVVDAAAVARRLGDPTSLGRAAAAFRVVPTMGSLDEEILALAAEAVAGLTDEDRALRSLLVSFAAYQRSIGGEGSAVADDARAASEDARLGGDPVILARVLSYRLAILMGDPSVPRQLAVADELAEVLTRASAPDELVDLPRLRGVIHLQMDNRAGFAADRAELEILALRTKSSFARSVLAMWRAAMEIQDGQLEAASASTDELLLLAGDDPNMALAWFAQRCWIAALQNRAAEMVPIVDEILSEHGDVPVVRAVAAWTLSHVDPDRAWAMMKPLAADGFAAIVPGWLLPGTLGLLTPIVAQHGTTGHCQDLLGLLSPYAGQMLVLGSGTLVVGSADGASDLLLDRLGADARKGAFAE